MTYKDFFYTTISKHIIDHNGKIIDCQYTKKLFHRFILELIIQYNGNTYKVTANKEGIYINDDFICDHSYEYYEKESTLGKLMRLMEEKIFANH